MGVTIDLSAYDLASLIEQETPIRLGKAHGRQGTRKGPCPWCGGADRFAVLDDAAQNKQRFICGIHGGAGCGKRGDAVDFIKLWRGVSFNDACNLLALTPQKDLKGACTQTPHTHTPTQNAAFSNEPGDDWRSVATWLLPRFQSALWSDAGNNARTFLHKRGFTDRYIEAYGYGYNPIDRYIDASKLGMAGSSKVWIPRGIVIPWFFRDELWKLNVRRSVVDMQRFAPNAKYVNIEGSADLIYRLDRVKDGKALVIVEGEFNADILAMVLHSAGRNDVAVVATGGTGKGRSFLSKIALSACNPALISFDPDEAGKRAAQRWRGLLPDAMLWPGAGGDVNEMYLSGYDLLTWLDAGIEKAVKYGAA
jgi:DNA primase